MLYRIKLFLPISQFKTVSCCPWLGSEGRICFLDNTLIAYLTYIREAIFQGSKYSIFRGQLYQLLNTICTGLRIFEIFEKYKEGRYYTVNRIQFTLDCFTVLLDEYTKDLIAQQLALYCIGIQSGKPWRLKL
jgi:hypothetical protein